VKPGPGYRPTGRICVATHHRSFHAIARTETLHHKRWSPAPFILILSKVARRRRRVDGFDADRADVRHRP
jgi:hypothetical protein